MDLNPLPAFTTRLRRLDVLIEREILRLRGRYQLSLDEFRGLYVSDEQVDQLLNQSVQGEQMRPYLQQLAQQIGMLDESVAQEHDPLRHLSELFGLNAVECDLLFFALAPELNFKYETLYAYLNDDVAKKWATIQIAQRLLDGPDATGNAVRMALAPAAPLVRDRLVVLGEGGTGLRSSTHQGFALSPLVAQFLLGLAPGTVALSRCIALRASALEWQSVPVTEDLRETLRRLPLVLTQSAPPLIVFSGETGSGKDQAKSALAAAMRCSMLEFDLAAAPNGPDTAELLDELALELKLWPAVLSVIGLERTLDAEGRPGAATAILSRWLRTARGAVILDVPSGFAWRRLFPALRGIEFDFDKGGYAQRAALWRHLSAHHDVVLTAEESALLAGRFDFSAGQIAAVIADATDMARLQSDPREERVAFAHILRSARACSDQHLGSLAIKVRRPQRWHQLVLAQTTLRHVREFTAAVRQRHVVFSEWGFRETLGHSGSLVALFAGVSGTGKTMTAGVIAAELDLDLYKADLSGMVSKYIGETEKNLDRIFDVARKANAMLFFDEADALFGKRSEVKDAHDRYANIETAYLLQKLEEHSGVVILATNIKRNIDEAFARRLQYVIEFPVPDVREREQLWRGMFPAAAPLLDDIDFGFLARQFALSGGNIRNVALDAAFLAAQAQAEIDMQRIIHALARQYSKQGKIPSRSEFGQYYEMLLLGWTTLHSPNGVDERECG
jgi:AAA+ superfamily predicted ATPase